MKEDKEVIKVAAAAAAAAAAASDDSDVVLAEWPIKVTE